MKKWLPALLCIALCVGLVLPAMAMNTQGVTFTAALDKETLNVSDSAQTVKLKISGTPAFDADAFEYEVNYPEGWTIENIASSDVNITAGDYNKTYADHTLKLFWNSPDAENVTGISDLGTITFTVPANTAAGDYTFTVSNFNVTKDYGTKWEQGSTMTATLTNLDSEGQNCTVTFDANGNVLTYTVTNAPSGSKLIAARYDGGRMTDVQIKAISGDVESSLTMGGSGDTFKLMLLDGATFAPLCPAYSAAQ